MSFRVYNQLDLLLLLCSSDLHFSFKWEALKASQSCRLGCCLGWFDPELNLTDDKALSPEKSFVESGEDFEEVDDFFWWTGVDVWGLWRSWMLVFRSDEGTGVELAEPRRDLMKLLAIESSVDDNDMDVVARFCSSFVKNSFKLNGFPLLSDGDWGSWSFFRCSSICKSYKRFQLKMLQTTRPQSGLSYFVTNLQKNNLASFCTFWEN